MRGILIRRLREPCIRGVEEGEGNDVERVLARNLYSFFLSFSVLRGEANPRYGDIKFR